MLLLKIVGAILALGLGVWLGLPGRGPSAAEIDKVLDQPVRRRRRVSRHFTPMDWFRREKRAPDRLSHGRFRVGPPDER